MPQATRPIHKKIVKLMSMLGYNVNLDGVCHGFTLMANQAMFSGTVDILAARLRRIAAIPDNDSDMQLWLDINESLCSGDDDNDLDEDTSTIQKEWIDLLAYFDGIQSYQSPHEPVKNHHYFFGDLVIQRTVGKIAPVLSSIALAEQGELHFLPLWLNVFHGRELVDYIVNLSRHIIGLNAPIGLCFSGHARPGLQTDQAHSISLYYEPDKRHWVLINANSAQLDDQSTDQLFETYTNPYRLAEAFQKALYIRGAVSVIGTMPMYLERHAITVTRAINRFIDQFQQATFLSLPDAVRAYLASDYRYLDSLRITHLYRHAPVFSTLDDARLAADAAASSQVRFKHSRMFRLQLDSDSHGDVAPCHDKRRF